MAERTEADIAISADPAAIMAVVADTVHYPDWCPGVRAAEIEELFPDGKPLDVQMVFDSGPIKDTHRYRYDSWTDTEVRWHPRVSKVTSSHGCSVPKSEGSSSNRHPHRRRPQQIPVRLRHLGEVVVLAHSVGGFRLVGFGSRQATAPVRPFQLPR